MKMVVANWKMNHLRQDALAFCRQVAEAYRPKAGVTARLGHISTGGGASLEFLSGMELPGVAELQTK